MKSLEVNIETNIETKVSIYYLIYNFLKIGCISFGGHMSLISVVQDQLVEKDGVLKNETVLDGMALASILPGPFAVNVVTYIGYRLLGTVGAIVSLIAVMTPSFVLVYLLSLAYFNYQNVLALNHLLDGVLPAVSAIILSVGISMSKKNIHNKHQVILLLVSCLVLIFFNSFFGIVSMIVIGGISGYYLFYQSGEGRANEAEVIVKLSRYEQYSVLATSIALFVILIAGIGLSQNLTSVSEFLQLGTVFSSMSLTLFGGGYVFIPVMQEIVVDTMGWLTIQEFADGIAMGQITPGPIMISSVFIGFKILGFWGALIAAISMFLPSGILTILCSRFVARYANSNIFKSILKGVHAVAIGMMFAAVYKVGIANDLTWQALVIFLLSLILLVKFQLKAVYVIPISALIGFFIF